MESNTTSQPYSKEQTLALYNQRKLEAEKAERDINYLKGNIGAQLEAVKKAITQLHPQVIEFYKIHIPSNFEELNSDQLQVLLNKLREVEVALGEPVQQYLQTGDMSLLARLPKLQDLSALQNANTQEEPLPEDKHNDADILRGI